MWHCLWHNYICLDYNSEKDWQCIVAWYRLYRYILQTSSGQSYKRSTIANFYRQFSSRYGASIIIYCNKSKPATLIRQKWRQKYSTNGTQNQHNFGAELFLIDKEQLRLPLLNKARLLLCNKTTITSQESWSSGYGRRYMGSNPSTTYWMHNLYIYLLLEAVGNVCLKWRK